MSNNIVLNAGTGGSTLATEQNGVAEQYQIMKVVDGTSAAFTNRWAITAAGAGKVDGSGSVQPVSDNGANLHVQGAAASGAAKAGNPLQLGGVFNTTQPTVTTGQAVELQASARGALIAATGADIFHVTVDSAPTTPVTGTFWQATQPVSGAVTANAGTNLNTSLLALESGNLASLLGRLPATAALADATANPTLSALQSFLMGYNGTTWDRLKSTTGSLNVHLDTQTLVTNATIQNASLAVTGTFFQATQPVSGTVTANAGTGVFDVTPASPVATDYLPVRLTDGTAFYTASGGAGGNLATAAKGTTAAGNPTSTALDANTQPLDVILKGTTNVSVSNFPGTQPVSAASLPLPTGAATSAKQPALGTAGVAAADVLTVQGIASMTALKVDGSAVTQPVSGTFWQATQPVSGTVAATQSGTWTVQPGNTANTTPWLSTNVPPSSGTLGWSFNYASALSTTKVQIKASAGTFGGYLNLMNPNTTDAFVQVFNKLSANVTLGTTAPDFVIRLPGLASASGTGVAANLEISNGIAMSTGITVAATTTATGAVALTNALSATFLFL